MPIYAYRCAACGHAKDVLQKLSDAPLTDCPACGAPRFEKQVTAAGFQLKGSGWYVTDFRDGQKKKGDAKGTDKAAAPAPEPAPTDTAAAAPPAAAPAAAPASPAPAPAAAPAPSSDSSS
jgi:putative FmdB family regulatory protein